ncbi:MAG: TVP38/TMEM64 family protein [Chromatiaceae bacterium]|nr:TVP38/TMEM64 family protein [Chromatiaceae bacterium]
MSVKPSFGSRWSGVAAALLVSAVLAGLYLVLSANSALAFLREPDNLRVLIESMGFWGPVAVVTFMVTAIVLSPLPSAPIALAAGTVYGHTLGTAYVLVGAELGALLAFGIARFAGNAFAKSWLDRPTLVRIEGSQGTMMAIVFVTRLLPFVSFDAVSYAAGLSPLSFWRFAVATLAGIIPASFVLAHLGAELTSDDVARVELVLIVLGVAVLLTLTVQLIRRSRGAELPQARRGKR